MRLRSLVVCGLYFARVRPTSASIKCKVYTKFDEVFWLHRWTSAIIKFSLSLWSVVESIVINMQIDVVRRLSEWRSIIIFNQMKFKLFIIMPKSIAFRMRIAHC